MARNVVLIVLFIVLYGGLMLMGSAKPEETIDRNGFGEFSDNKYYCESCNFEMEFSPKWISMDGISVEKMYSDEELLNQYGNAGDFDIIAGLVAPEFDLNCIRFKNITLDKNCFTTTYLERELDYYKQNISLVGGTLSGSGCKVIQAQGNGADMGIYYCDYSVDGQFYSIIASFVNCGKDYIYFSGVYENKEGLNMILDFLSTGVTFNSSSAINV